MNEITRRKFIKTLFVGSAGLWVSSKLAPVSAFGNIPWEERLDSSLLGEDAKKFTLSKIFSPSKGIKNEYPSVAVDEKDKVWMCWTEETPQGEEIRAASFADGTFNTPVSLSSSPGYAFQAEMLLFNGSGLVVWTEYQKAGVWNIFAARIKNGTVQNVFPVSESEGIAWKPALARDSAGTIWIVWEEKKGTSFHIMTRTLQGDRLMNTVRISEEDDRDNCRPAIASTPKGRVWIAWDKLTGKGNANIMIREFDASGSPSSKTIALTESAGLDVAPSLNVDAHNRLWVAWHSNRWGNDNRWDVPRWFRLKCYYANEIYEPVQEPAGKTNELKDTIQSFEFVKVYSTSDGRILITGRASHNFYLQIYQGSEWSRIYRFPEDGWGGRGKYLKIAEDSQGDLWVTRRDLNHNALQKLTLPKQENPPMAVLKMSGKETVHLSIPNALKKPTFEPWNDYRYFFGDIHGHTWISDGVGDIDEYYITRRDFYKHDFASLTDHDTFVGNGLIPSEWEYIKEITTHFNEPGSFVTFYGQEWTTARWPKAFGHKNIYHIDPTIPLFDHTDEGTDTSRALFEKVKKAGAIAVPHHIGWTGVDWENHDPVAQPLVEIVSVHGAFEYMGNKPIPHRGGLRGCFVQDGLARGFRFGIVGGSDSHGLIWHHRVCYKRDPNRAGWSCILAKELTRESLWDALKKRRCYATSGIWLRMVFEINGHMMGEEFETSEPPVIRIDVNAESELKWLEIVRNNETIYRYGGEGFRSRFSYEDTNAPKGVSYYYLRVVCEDDNMAWSSPIWVKLT